MPLPCLPRRIWLVTSLVFFTRQEDDHDLSFDSPIAETDVWKLCTISPFGVHSIFACGNSQDHFPSLNTPHDPSFGPPEGLLTDPSEGVAVKPLLLHSRRVQPPPSPTASCCAPLVVAHSCCQKMAPASPSCPLQCHRISISAPGEPDLLAVSVS